MAKRSGSALEALDEPVFETTGAVAVADAPKELAVPAIDLTSEVEDALERVIDDSESIRDIRYLEERGFSGQKLDSELFRIRNLRRYAKEALLPEETVELSNELEQLRPVVESDISARQTRIRELLAEVADLEAEIGTERAKLTVREQRLESAHHADTMLEKHAPAAIYRLMARLRTSQCRSQMERANELEQAVAIRENCLTRTSADCDWFRQISNMEFTTHPLEIPELRGCSPSNAMAVVQTKLPALIERCREELPALQHDLRIARAELLQALEQIASPMRAHVRHWILKARASADRSAAAG